VSVAESLAKMAEGIDALPDKLAALFAGASPAADVEGAPRDRPDRPVLAPSRPPPPVAPEVSAPAAGTFERPGPDVRAADGYRRPEPLAVAGPAPEAMRAPVPVAGSDNLGAPAALFPAAQATVRDAPTMGAAQAVGGPAPERGEEAGLGGRIVALLERILTALEQFPREGELGRAPGRGSGDSGGERLVFEADADSMPGQSGMPRPPSVNVGRMTGLRGVGGFGQFARMNRKGR